MVFQSVSRHTCTISASAKPFLENFLYSYRIYIAYNVLLAIAACRILSLDQVPHWSKTPGFSGLLRANGQPPAKAEAAVSDLRMIENIAREMARGPPEKWRFFTAFYG